MHHHMFLNPDPLQVSLLYLKFINSANQGTVLKSISN